MIDTDKKKKEKYLQELVKKNGYPRSFVQNTFWNCEAKKRKERKSEEKKTEKPNCKDTIVLPHVTGSSEQIQRVPTPLDIRIVNNAEKLIWESVTLN